MPHTVGKNGENGDYSKEICEKQKILRDLIDSAGWSVRKFYSLYCSEIQNFDDENEHKACMEKLKKQITTQQKSCKTLVAMNNYIFFIENHEDFKKSGKIRLQAISDSLQDDDIKDRMRSISKEIDNLLLKKYQIQK